MSIVQSVWIGSALPPLQQLSIRSFLAEGHEYHLYTYDNVAEVPDGATICDGSEILPRDAIFCYQHGFGQGSYSAFSNLFRYKLIFERGGWWVDTDVVCLRMFQFDDSFVFATENDDDGTVNCATCAFKCPAGASVLEYCIDVVLSRNKDTLRWGEIGPQLFSAAVRRYGLTAHCTPVEIFNPVDFVDFSSLVAPGFDMTRLAQSYAVHFWNQMWKSRNMDPTADPPPDSLSGILREKYARPASIGPSSRRTRGA